MKRHRAVPAKSSTCLTWNRRSVDNSDFAVLSAFLPWWGNTNYPRNNIFFIKWS